VADCDHRMCDADDGLRCVLHDGHAYGHRYESSDGNYLNDKHGEQGHG